MNKICVTCGQEKNLSEFGKNAGRKDGFNLKCKSCYNSYMRNYLGGNPKHIERVRKSDNKYNPIDHNNFEQASKFIANYKLDRISRRFVLCLKTISKCIDCPHNDGKQLYFFLNNQLVSDEYIRENIKPEEANNLDAYCAQHKRERFSKRRNKNTRRAYMRQLYREKADKLKEQLGGKCVKCGAVENLEFDHIDPSTKSFGVCSAILSVSWDRVLEEVAKCQLLCEDCHLDKTLDQRWGIARSKP